MPTRVCDKCGKHRELQGGRTCERGHFICRHCVHELSGVFFTRDRKSCPLCKTQLK